MNEVAYTPEPLDNPNFISRPPDPGPLKLYATVGWDALYHSPFSGAYRSSELMLEKNPYFNVDGNTLSGEEATKKYGMGGQLKFDEPIKETAASLIAQRKMDENDRDYVIGSGETNSFRKATSIPVGMAASLLDPVNTASMFVPVVGEAKFAAMTAKYGGSVLKARLLKGAYQGLVGTAMVEPFVLIPNMQQQANYDIGDSALALGYGVGLGAFLHAGLGAMHDHLQKFSQNDRNAIFEAAMNNVLNDKPVTSPARIAEFAEPNPIHQFEGEGGRIPTERDPSTVETPQDHARYQEINARQAELRSQDPAGHLANEEYQQLSREIEDIKNRNSSDPGMPPEAPAETPKTTPLQELFRDKTIKHYTQNDALKIKEEGFSEPDTYASTGNRYRGDFGHNVLTFGNDSLHTIRIDYEDLLQTRWGQVIDEHPPKEPAKPGPDGQPQLPDQYFIDQIKRDPSLLHELPIIVGDSSKIAGAYNLDQIPRRDASGKFLSKAQRLEMLQQQIADQQSRVKLQDEKIHTDTQKEVTRLTTEEVRNTTETPKVLTEIQSEIPKLEKEAFPETVAMDDEAKIAAEAERQNFEKDLEREIGNPAKREKGVNAGVNCINNNLI